MKNKKWITAATAAVFLMILTAVPLSWYLQPEEAREQNSENRVLAEFPAVNSVKDILTFPSRFESWYSDHLPYKEQMVSLKSDAEISLFRQLDSEQVILGTQTPWLFYKAADGQPIETYKRINQFSEESLSAITEVLDGLQTRLYEAGIDFVLLITPDKETIYGMDYMPDEIKVETDRVHRTDQLLRYLSEHAPDIRVLYPRDAFLTEKEELIAAARTHSEETGETCEAWPLYYESDTHWNKIGAKICADELFAMLADEDRNYLTEYIDISFTDLSDGSDPEYPNTGEKMYMAGDLQTLCKLPAAYDSQVFHALGQLPADLTYQVESPAGEAVYQRYYASDSRCAKRSLYLVGDSFRWNLDEFIRGRTETCTVASRYYLDLDDVLEQSPDTFVYMLAERYLHELEVLPGVAAPALEYTEEFKRADIY